MSLVGVSVEVVPCLDGRTAGAVIGGGNWGDSGQTGASGVVSVARCAICRAELVAKLKLSGQSADVVAASGLWSGDGPESMGSGEVNWRAVSCCPACAFRAMYDAEVICGLIMQVAACRQAVPREAGVMSWHGSCPES